MRTVEIHLEPEDQKAIAEITTHHRLQEAIGYLSSWSISSYPLVKIWPDGNGDLVADYFDECGALKYVIGAIWHGDHYGFHS